MKEPGFCDFDECVTQPTNRPTDTAYYRDARTHLKKMEEDEGIVQETRPDTRQNSRGWLGRCRNTKIGCTDDRCVKVKSRVTKNNVLDSSDKRTDEPTDSL